MEIYLSTKYLHESLVSLFHLEALGLLIFPGRNEVFDVSERESRSSRFPLPHGQRRMIWEELSPCTSERTLEGRAARLKHNLLTSIAL